jgi:antitoxin ParD1/3/4
VLATLAPVDSEKWRATEGVCENNFRPASRTPTAQTIDSPADGFKQFAGTETREQLDFVSRYYYREGPLHHVELREVVVLAARRDFSASPAHDKSHHVGYLTRALAAMENASLTISLPKAMKKFIEARLHHGNFSTPSEYIRSLVRVDQERSSRGELEAFLRGGLRGKTFPTLDDDGWRAVENFLLERVTNKRAKRRVAAR